MENERESKEYSWAWVGAARLLSKGACELLYAKLTPDAAAANVTLYDGENTTGEVIVTLRTSGLFNCECNPCRPLYCRKGLYVGTPTDGDVLLQWRELGQK